MSDLKEAIEAAIGRHDGARRAKLAELTVAADAMKATSEAAKQTTKGLYGFLTVLDEPVWIPLKEESFYWSQDLWPTLPRTLPITCYCHDPSCTRIPHRPFIVETN